MFFFEKKNQKTFTQKQSGKQLFHKTKVFRFFFSKKNLLLFFLLLSGPAQAACDASALGVSRVIAIDRKDGLALGLQSYPRTLDLHDHEVVLTFDDGPAATTAHVLDVLAQECVRATFFLIGRNAERHPELVRREIAEGHSVGHHSYSHPARTLRLMDAPAALSDIDAGIAAVEAAGYGVASSRPHVPFFRFPGFADTPELLAALAARGMTVFGSDLWASDWNRMTPDTELALVLSRLDSAGKGIILFHDTKVSTVQMLPAFLRALKDREYHVVHLVPGAGPTPVVDAPADWTSTTEPIVARTLAPAPVAAKRVLRRDTRAR